MIDVDYNEYKEALEQNMKLVIENHKLKEIIKVAREYTANQRLHKFEDTTGGLTYKERKLLEILDKAGSDKE